MNEDGRTCQWCNGRGEIGPRTDSYVCPRCAGTGRVSGAAWTTDAESIRNIRAHQPEWDAEDWSRSASRQNS